MEKDCDDIAHAGLERLIELAEMARHASPDQRLRLIRALRHLIRTFQEVGPETEADVPPPCGQIDLATLLTQLRIVGDNPFIQRSPMSYAEASVQDAPKHR